MIDLLLLGNGAMTPLPDRWLSSLLVRCQGELTLFDCGEGTQIAWRTFGWGFRRVGAICLSHCHADHVAGLPGILHSLANAGRTEPVAVYGPIGTELVVAGLRTIARDLPFAVSVRELGDGDACDLPGGLSGRVAAGEHRVPSLVYRVSLTRARRFDPARAESLGVPLPLWRALQRGEAVAWAEGEAAPDDVLGAPRRGLAFGFVTDTRPRSAMATLLRGVDLLVCEGTYGDPADAAKAAAWKHMTFTEAATLARDADARALWLTHFSPAMADPASFLPEATATFPNTTIGASGLTATLTFDDENES